MYFSLRNLAGLKTAQALVTPLVQEAQKIAEYSARLRSPDEDPKHLMRDVFKLAYEQIDRNEALHQKINNLTEKHAQAILKEWQTVHSKYWQSLEPAAQKKITGELKNDLQVIFKTLYIELVDDSFKNPAHFYPKLDDLLSAPPQHLNRTAFETFFLDQDKTYCFPISGLVKQLLAYQKIQTQMALPVAGAMRGMTDREIKKYEASPALKNIRAFFDFDQFTQKYYFKNDILQQISSLEDSPLKSRLTRLYQNRSSKEINYLNDTTHAYLVKSYGGPLQIKIDPESQLRGTDHSFEDMLTHKIKVTPKRIRILSDEEYRSYFYSNSAKILLNPLIEKHINKKVPLDEGAMEQLKTILKFLKESLKLSDQNEDAYVALGRLQGEFSTALNLKGDLVFMEHLMKGIKLNPYILKNYFHLHGFFERQLKSLALNDDWQGYKTYFEKYFMKTYLSEKYYWAHILENKRLGRSGQEVSEEYLDFLKKIHIFYADYYRFPPQGKHDSVVPILAFLSQFFTLNRRLMKKNKDEEIDEFKKFINSEPYQADFQLLYKIIKNLSLKTGEEGLKSVFTKVADTLYPDNPDQPMKTRMILERVYLLLNRNSKEFADADFDSVILVLKKALIR